MEPSSPDVSFGPGRWLVLEARAVPGVVTGEVIEVAIWGGSWRFIRPTIGLVASSRMDQTRVLALAQQVTVANAKDGISLTLSPAGSTQPTQPTQLTQPWAGSEPPATLTRVYPGKPEAAAWLMREDAARLEPHGYVAISQNYAPGEWGCGAWVLAFFLLIFIVGLLVIAYMIAVHPDGTLTVVYERRGQALATPAPATASQQAPAQAFPSASIATDLAASGAETPTKICPQCAEQVKAAALICRYCRYEFGPLPPAGQSGTQR